MAASGGLDATLGGYHYSKPHGRNGFSKSKKNPEMTYHMCVCPKFILRPFLRSHYASGGIRFGKCCTFVLKSVGIDILAASGGLYAILGGYYYSIPLEHGRNGFSNSKKNEHGRNGFINSKPPEMNITSPKNHLEVVFEAAFGLWRPPI